MLFSTVESEVKKYTHLLLIALAFFAVSLVSSLTTVAVVHALGGSDLIFGCVTNNGSLKIISANASCGQNETSLTWNARGLPGTGALVENLHGAQINNTDFRWRTLKDDDFTGTNCSLGSNVFDHTDLTNVNLTGCFLGSSNFNREDFTSTTLGNNNFQNAVISNSNLSNRDLSGDNLTSINWDSSNLTGVNASNADLSAGSITNSNLTNANFSNLTFSAGGNVFFNTSSLFGTNFTAFHCPATCVFDGTTGSNTNFTNANLTNSTFTGASLTTPIWSNTTCPDGTNSDSNGGTCSGHGGGL